MMRSWVTVAAITVALLGWLAAIYFLVGDEPPTWNYGSGRLLPGEAGYSTPAPPRGAVPRQVPAAPAPQGARP